MKKVESVKMMLTKLEVSVAIERFLKDEGIIGDDGCGVVGEPRLTPSGEYDHWMEVEVGYGLPQTGQPLMERGGEF